MNVWLHVFAAAAWIGFMVFFSAVVVPLLRRAELRATAPVLLRMLGQRYRVLGWIALTTLIVTGLMNLQFRGFTWAVLSQSEFWAHGFGQLLAWKLALVVVVLVMTLMHEKSSRGKRSRCAAARSELSSRSARAPLCLAAEPTGWNRFAGDFVGLLSRWCAGLVSGQGPRLSVRCHDTLAPRFIHSSDASFVMDAGRLRHDVHSVGGGT
jgi:uncharacterized membrane protein